jgi:hypothetical protein
VSIYSLDVIVGGIARHGPPSWSANEGNFTLQEAARKLGTARSHVPFLSIRFLTEDDDGQSAPLEARLSGMAGRLA